MNEGILTKLRSRLSYANVMSTLAVFLLVAGGGAYAASKLKRNAVKSKNIAPNAVKGVDADEATFGEVPLAATANGVSPNSIGPAEVRDPIRAINLPLTSFVNEADQDVLDFTSAGTPNLELTGPMHLTWDADTDGGGADVADTDSVRTSFMVPPDYVSGSTVALRVSKDGHGGVTERFRCVFVVGSVAGAELGFTIPTATSTTYVLNLSPPGSPSIQVGRPAAVNCRGDNGAGGSTADHAIQLEGAEFRYTAAQ